MAAAGESGKCHQDATAIEWLNMRIYAYLQNNILEAVNIVKMDPIFILKSLSDETRLRALYLLSQEGELCVCELMQGLDMAQPKVSRHMALLKEAGVVEARRQAQWVFFRLNPLLVGWQQQLVGAALAGAAASGRGREDMARLRAMENRPKRCVTA